jgi:hypothetical protein
VVRRRPSAERDVRSDHAGERTSTHAGQLPEVLVRSRSSGQRIAIGFDATAAHDDDGIRAELRNGAFRIGVAERYESEVHAFRPGDAKVGTGRAARLLAGGTSELVLGVDPTSAVAEGVGPAVLPIGDQRLTAHHHVFERPDRRKLSVDRLALGEERQIETGFHAEEA